MSVKALVFVGTDPKRTRPALEKLPQPSYVVTGRYDGVALVQNETLKALGEQVVSQIRSQEGVARTETFPILREVTGTGRTQAPVRAFVLVRTEGRRTEQVFGALAGLPETAWAATLGGRYDVVVQIGGTTWEELSNVLLSRIRTVEGVLGTETFFIAG